MTAAAKMMRRRPSRPITLQPDLFWHLEFLAGRDGYLDARTWIVAQLKAIVKARAGELSEDFEVSGASVDGPVRKVVS
jgi:hypothetical protein